MSKKSKDRKHLQAVRELGCICCRIDGLGLRDASAHHIREGQGMAQKASDYETIPLCVGHHQTGFIEGRGKVLAVHLHYRQFVEKYGSERHLVERTLQELEENKSFMV